MDSKSVSMETKKDIYLSWVHYTTKNEESYFRHFIRGFVTIWESQLQLDWSKPETLPDWSSLKHDTGPHLSRLPEELLPAIGKFIYIAKDKSDQGILTQEEILEVDLLVRCLIAISRNLDNIPFIASCDYVSHSVAIASSIIQKIVGSNCTFEHEGLEFCLSLCHLLESIYDPYFTWRHFLPSIKVPFDKLTFQPALLHVEVVPFIYDCFQVEMVNKYPKLAAELLNVLGAVISGAQHNALRSVCPATASIIMNVVSSGKSPTHLRKVALQSFVVMVKVLHNTPPPQRQIEVTTLVDLYKEAFTKMLSEEWKKNYNDELELLFLLTEMVNTVSSLLAMSSLCFHSLHLTIIESNIIDNLLNALDCVSKLSSELEKSNFVTECVKAISAIVTGTFDKKDLPIKVNWHERLFSRLVSYGNPSRTVLEALVAVVYDSDSSELTKLRNTNTLIPLINWLSDMDEENQVWLANQLVKICTSNLNSLSLSCEAGVVRAVCDLLSSKSCKDLHSKAAAELIQLLEALASHSLTAFELKQIFLLLREDNHIKNMYRGPLLNCLSVIARKGAMQIDCNDYFDIQDKSDGIAVIDTKKWTGASYGFSFHCWLRLDQQYDVKQGQQQSTSHRRQLFNLATASGTGMEAFFYSDGALVVGVNTKKEFLAATVPECSLFDGVWHCLDICYMGARRPFGHNQLSVFIDGIQRLAASIKFPAFTDPFSVCTVGSMPDRSTAEGQANNEKSSAVSSVVEKGLLPSFISQVPNYFSLPLRSTVPLDPNVKNFPPGMQDTLFGPPTCLRGQLGLVCLFHEPLTPHQVKTLHDGGPNCRSLFSLEDSPEHLVLSSKLVWCFSPAACWEGQCLDLSAPGKYSATAVARICHTQTLRDVINGVGGVHILFPILESVSVAQSGDGPDLSVFSPSPSPSPSQSQELDDWELLPSSNYSDAKLQQNPVSSFLILLRNILMGSQLNQDNLLKHNGVAILGNLLSKVSPNVMDIPVLVAVQRLVELAKGLGSTAHSHKGSLSHRSAAPQPVLLRSIHQHIVFNFNIWSRCPFHVKVGHIQYISTVIKDERKVFRKRYGVQFLLDTIRRHYSTGSENNENKAIRVSLLGLIKYYLQKECNTKEIAAIIGFLVTVKEEILVMEVLDMLVAHLESKSCRDQVYLLMYEPQTAEMLYCLLTEKHFSMELKQRVLKMLSILLRSEKVYDRYKGRLRLNDSTPCGLYPGLIAMLPENQFSMEFTVILLEQILLTESSASYAGALSLVHALALCDVDVKLEAARKILTVTFMHPQQFAKQLGWQDCITRLLVKCPISTQKSDSLPDLMSFEEEILDNTSVGGGRCSPSSVSRLSLSDAASTLELEIKEVAESVTSAVADNIHYAADNISYAVASAYNTFKQKTVEMQESLEEFGETARSRLKKRRSLTSLHDPESPRPVRTSQLLASLGLDMDTISFTNRSQSSSDEGETEETSTSPQMSLESCNSTTSASTPSLVSTQTNASVPEESDEDEKILFDALQQLKALDAEKVFDREQELCYLVVNILFTIMWRGIDGSSKDAWKERGQVMACINWLGLNNTLHCSHLELKLRLLEMAVTAALSDLRDSTSSENAAQLLRWVYDLTVLDPNHDHSKKASPRLLDGVLGLLDSLLVFQEVPGEEWAEMAKLAFGILLSCASYTNLELCAMATAKLHTLIQTRTMNDAQEGGYLLYFINTILQAAIKEENQEHYSFLIPVVKALLEKLKDMLKMSTHLPDLPQPQAGPAFYEGFESYCQGSQWKTFIENKVKPLYETYQTSLTAELTETMNTFWAECYEASKTSSHRRNREVGESKLRFQSQIMSGYRSRQTEESVRYNNLSSRLRNRDLLVRRHWRQMREFFIGERGAWCARESKQRHWKLSWNETFSRMRLKLRPNLYFNPHTDASNLRDNTGWMSRMRSDEVPLSTLNLSSVAVRSDTDDTDHIPEDDIWTPADGETEVAGVEVTGETGANVGTGKEKIILSQECDLVILMSAVKGRLDVSTTHVYFYDLSPVKEDVERYDFKWPLTRLREIYLRRYNLRRSALEFFLIDQTNYFLNFTTKTRNKVVSRLLSLRPPNLLYHRSCSPADLLRTLGLTQKWVNREITNFDYLMQLNTLAGRTYNDLSQYPVFPWILADYTSTELDLSDPKTFRDLSKPIGIVNPDNEPKVRAKYDSFEDPSGTVAKFHYGSHYSNSAGVLHYLVRVEPFTSLHIELQSGRFDVADRQFYSIPQTWRLLMYNPNDVKELTPEFFYFPEFLKNQNKFDLGLLQGTKERVNDVVLPPWASSPEDFIFKHRKALESEYVSSHLHEWIDLIFGYKQKGPKAIEALNVFYYCSYEGAVDLDAITNSVEREAVEGMINYFGQTPSQLLKEPHPPRLSQAEASTRMLKSDARKPDITHFLDKLTTFQIEVLNEKDPVVFVSTPRSPPRGFLQSSLPDSLVTVSKSAAVGVHSWLPHDKHSNRGFTFDIDPTLSNAKTRRNVGGSFHPSMGLHSKLFALSHDGKLLLTAGHWDASVRVFSLTRNKVIHSVIRHFDLVTCLALDQCGWYLASGSLDCTCVVWDISQLGSAPPRPFQTFYGHDKPVTCVAIATELDTLVSGSCDGTVNVYTIHEGNYLRTLYPIGCDNINVDVTFITISFQGHIAFSANDKKSHSVHVFSINGDSLGSKYVAGRVTGLATAGDCLVVVDDAGDLTISRLLGLYPVYDVPLHVPVQSVVVTSDNTHLLVPLRDGTVTVIGVPNS